MQIPKKRALPSLIWLLIPNKIKHRHKRVKITFLIRQYNDIVLYIVPPVKKGAAHGVVRHLASEQLPPTAPTDGL